MTKLFNLYDPLTGLFANVFEAHESPEEKGVFIRPDASTLHPVPALAANEAAVFDVAADAWTVVPDYRGQTAYDASGSAVVIDQHGVLPAGLSLTEPQSVIDNRNADARTAQLVNVRALREVVLGRLEGIASRATRAGDTTGIAAACDSAAVALLDITAAPAVLAATDGPSTKVALAAEWAIIAANLATAAPAAAKAFSGLSLT